MRYWLCGAATTKNWAPSKSLPFHPLSKVDRIKNKKIIIFQYERAFLKESVEPLSYLPTINFSGRFKDRRGGGGWGQHRYGCAVSTKPRPGKISPENLMNVWAKVPKNLVTGQVFMNFRVPKLKIFSK